MNPETVEDVIIDFEGRRSAILTVLTDDFHEFDKQCDPTIQQSPCLYGSPDSHWMVKPPSPYFDLPDPKSGINIVRDDMDKHDWLSMVALHSDVWLNAVPFYYAAKLGFGKSDRLRLFEKIASFSSISKSVSIGSMNKEKKRGALPEELLLEVLSRVPVRNLVGFRTVCKRWKRLIDDYGFVSIHLTNYKPNFEGSHLLVIQETIPSYTVEKVMVCHPNTFRKVHDLENCLIDKHGCTKFRIWDYINGVMLIMKGITHKIDDIILWNPSINKSLDISNPAFHNDLEDDALSLLDIGLGIDASNNDLKVVAFIYPHTAHASHRRFHAIVPGYIQVYALSTKSWRTNASVCPPPYWSTEPQVFINGCIHWPSLGPELRDGDAWRNLRDSHIVSFDVSKEVINYFELPNIRIQHETTLIVIDGLLGMLYSCGSHHQVWVMEEYGVQKSWSQRYKFEIQFDELVHFKSNGELIFALNHGGIRLYDIKRKSLNDLMQPGYSSIRYNIYTYVESLLLG